MSGALELAPGYILNMEVHDSKDRETPQVDGEPRRARVVQLARHDSVAVVARAALAEASAHFLQNATSLVGTSDPELVHQSRVGLRRLRVFVGVFRGRIGKKRARRLGGELRWLFRLLGRLRDLQLLQNAGFRDEDPAQRVVQERLAKRLGTAQQELTDALASARFSGLQRDLLELGDQLAARSGRGKSARRFLRRRLGRLHRAAEAAAKEATTYEALHELRKRLKTMRYTAELSSGLYLRRAKRVRRYLRALRDLQDDLGEWVDKEVARGLRTELELADASLARGGEASLGEIAPSLPAFLHVEPFWS